MAQAPKEVHHLSRLPSIAETEKSVSLHDVSASSDSQRTSTDTSTIWGPGTASGRALLALGEAAIRGIDSLLIRRRLATIRLRTSSLTGSRCNDLLELCRPDMYSVRIAKQALTLTLSRICAGPESSVYLFVVSLCKWPREEARLILLELVRSLPAEVTRPSGWKLDRLYDFLTTIIQVEDGWRSFVLEAAVLLAKRCPPTITHPIHSLSATADPAQESPLSNLQKAYSPHMRSKTWISLQACGMSVQNRILEIEKILLEPNSLSTASLVDALADVSIFLGSQSGSHSDSNTRASVLTCFESFTAAQWHSVRAQSELSVLVNFVWEEATTNPMHAAILLRTTLCRPCVSQTLTNAIAQKIIRGICGSDGDQICCALSISTLSKNEVEDILKTIITNELFLVCIQRDTLAAERLCGFLATIFQITGEYISEDIARDLSVLPVRHPVITIAAQIVEETEVTPLSQLQTLSRYETLEQWDIVRLKTWMVLQTHGLHLETRLSQIEDTLSGKFKVSNPQIFDAVADASIFTRENFSPKLRFLAFDCLLKYCLTPVLGQIYEPLAYYPGFYHELEHQKITREQSLNKSDDAFTLLNVLYEYHDLQAVTAISRQYPSQL